MADELHDLQNAINRPDIDFGNDLISTRKYGYIFFTLLGGAFSTILILVEIVGISCPPASACASENISLIWVAKDFAVALSLAAALGAVAWLLAAVVKAALRRFLGTGMTSLALSLLTVGAAWFAFDPAMRVFFWLAYSN